jgi:hypothetical protein
MKYNFCCYFVKITYLEAKKDLISLTFNLLKRYIVKDYILKKYDNPIERVINILRRYLKFTV